MTRLNFQSDDRAVDKWYGKIENKSKRKKDKCFIEQNDWIEPSLCK